MDNKNHNTKILSRKYFSNSNKRNTTPCKLNMLKLNDNDNSFIEGYIKNIPYKTVCERSQKNIRNMSTDIIRLKTPKTTTNKDRKIEEYIINNFTKIKANKITSLSRSKLYDKVKDNSLINYMNNSRNIKAKNENIKRTFYNNTSKNASLNNSYLCNTNHKSNNVEEEITDRTLDKIKKVKSLLVDLKSKNNHIVNKELDKINENFFIKKEVTIHLDKDNRFLRDKIDSIDKKFEIILKENKNLKNLIEDKTKHFTTINTKLDSFKKQIVLMKKQPQNYSKSNINFKNTKKSNDYDDLLKMDTIEFLNKIPIDPKKVLHMPIKVISKKNDVVHSIPKLNIQDIELIGNQNENQFSNNSNMNASYNIDDDNKLNHAFVEKSSRGSSTLTQNEKLLKKQFSFNFNDSKEYFTNDKPDINNNDMNNFINSQHSTKPGSTKFI